jgi:hypothetical protein
MFVYVCVCVKVARRTERVMHEMLVGMRIMHSWYVCMFVYVCICLCVCEGGEEGRKSNA